MSGPISVPNIEERISDFYFFYLQTLTYTETVKLIDIQLFLFFSLLAILFPLYLNIGSTASKLEDSKLERIIISIILKHNDTLVAILQLFFQRFFQFPSLY
jgi:hypothetical protein